MVWTRDINPLVSDTFQRHDDGSDKNTSSFGSLRDAALPENDLLADDDRRVCFFDGYEKAIVTYSIRFY